MDQAQMFDAFRALEKNLESDHSIRDRIRDAVRDLESSERELTVILQAIHRKPDEATILDTCNRCDAVIEGPVKEKLKKLMDTIPEGEYYKFSDHFRMTTQRIVFACAISHFLRAGTLITREQVDTKLGVTGGVSNASADGQPKVSQHRFNIDLEDFLTGLLMLANELSRFAVNAVTSGDYERPKRVAQLLADLDAGFRLLTLKNDALRRRYDSLKYELKKVEEIVYDVSIRRLANPQQ